ncbi:MAG: hypothetical protein AAGF87_15225 [Bacteroidota bacterium]
MAVARQEILENAICGQVKNDDVKQDANTRQASDPLKGTVEALYLIEVLALDGLINEVGEYARGDATGQRFDLRRCRLRCFYQRPDHPR